MPLHVKAGDELTAFVDFERAGQSVSAGQLWRVVSVPRKLVTHYCVEPVAGEPRRVVLEAIDFELIFGFLRESQKEHVAPDLDPDEIPLVKHVSKREPGAAAPEEKNDALVARRVVHVQVSPEALADFFSRPRGSVMSIVEQPLPEGARFVGATYEQWSGVFLFWFEHESFELVEAATVPPARNVVLHFKYPDAPTRKCTSRGCEAQAFAGSNLCWGHGGDTVQIQPSPGGHRFDAIGRCINDNCLANNVEQAKLVTRCPDLPHLPVVPHCATCDDAGVVHGGYDVDEPCPACAKPKARPAIPAAPNNDEEIEF